MAQKTIPDYYRGRSSVLGQVFAKLADGDEKWHKTITRTTLLAVCRRKNKGTQILQINADKDVKISVYQRSSASKQLSIDLSNSPQVALKLKCALLSSKADLKPVRRYNIWHKSWA